MVWMMVVWTAVLMVELLVGCMVWKWVHMRAVLWVAVMVLKLVEQWVVRKVDERDLL